MPLSQDGVMDNSIKNSFCLCIFSILFSSTIWAQASHVFQPSGFRSDRHKALYSVGKSYSELLEKGGWPSLLIESDQTMEVATLSEANRVRLTERLNATDDISKKMFSLDSHLIQKLKHFQRRHGLEESGQLTPETIAKLNQPVSEKLVKINDALRKWETLPKNLGRNFIFINISNFALDVYKDNKYLQTFPVIVGEASPGQYTPQLNDEIEKIVFNPYWNVPLSIVRSEVLPNAKHRIEWYTSRNFELVKEYHPSSMVYGWTKSTLKLFEQGKLRIRQKKGPENTLGQIKFLFPNKHAIYIHDTPKKELFGVAKRAYSHGCVRVKKPEHLATVLIQMSQENWSLNKTQSLLESGITKTVELKNRVPVYIANFTTFVNADGEVIFRENVYDKLAINK